MKKWYKLFERIAKALEEIAIYLLETYEKEDEEEYESKKFWGEK